MALPFELAEQLGELTPNRRDPALHCTADLRLSRSTYAPQHLPLAPGFVLELGEP